MPDETSKSNINAAASAHNGQRTFTPAMVPFLPKESALAPVAPTDSTAQRNRPSMPATISTQEPLTALAQMVSAAVLQQSADAKQKAEIEMKKEEVRLERSRVHARTTKHRVSKNAERFHARERTVRGLGGLAVVGLFAFLLCALFLKLIDNPVAAIPTLGFVVVSAFLLAERSKRERELEKLRAFAARHEDDEDEDDEDEG
jgi:hypothetical protein